MSIQNVSDQARVWEILYKQTTTIFNNGLKVERGGMRKERERRGEKEKEARVACRCFHDASELEPHCVDSGLEKSMELFFSIRENKQRLGVNQLKYYC